MANQSTPIYDVLQPESFLEILQADATAQPSPTELQADFERIMKMLDSFQSPSISVQPLPTTIAEQHGRGVTPPPIFIEQTYGQEVVDASPERKRRYHQSTRRLISQLDWPRYLFITSKVHSRGSPRQREAEVSPF